jgi:hypothetical protein
VLALYSPLFGGWIRRDFSMAGGGRKKVALFSQKTA